MSVTRLNTDTNGDLIIELYVGTLDEWVTTAIVDATGSWDAFEDFTTTLDFMTESAAAEINYRKASG